MELGAFRNVVQIFKAEHVEVNRSMSSEFGSRFFNDVTRTSWHLKLQINQLFVQRLAPANNNENVKTPRA